MVLLKNFSNITTLRIDPHFCFSKCLGIEKEVETILGGTYTHVAFAAPETYESGGSDLNTALSLRLICLAEGLTLGARDGASLLCTTNGDIRQSLLSLQFWGSTAAAAFPTLPTPVGTFVTHAPYTACHSGLAEALGRATTPNDPIMPRHLLDLGQEAGLNLLYSNYLPLFRSSPPSAVTSGALSALADSSSLIDLLTPTEAMVRYSHSVYLKNI